MEIRILLKIYKIFLFLWFLFVQAQGFSQWSAPRPIDSMAIYNQRNPLVTVSKDGKIAAVVREGNRLILYRSTNSGISFSRYIAATTNYWEDEIHIPFTIAYDTSNTLWLLWGLDLYYGGFGYAYYHILSKSLDDGNTFSEVFRFNRGLILNNPRMVIDKSNTIHLLRDSIIWSVGSRFVYSRLNSADPSSRYDVILPQPQEPDQQYEAGDLAVKDSTIHFAIEVQRFIGTEYEYWTLYTRSFDYGISFTPLIPIDTTTPPSQFFPRAHIIHDGSLLITYAAQIGVVSRDNGNTFCSPFPVGSIQPAWDAQMNSDDSSTYLLYSGYGAVYNRFKDIQMPPVDSMSFDGFVAGDIAIGPRGEKYIVLSKFIANFGYKTYFSSRDIPSSVEDGEAEIPKSFTIKSAPNPFNSSTRLFIELPYADEIDLVVYNILGESVWQISLGKLQTGKHSIIFDGSNLTSGFYIARIKGSKTISTTKLLLLK